MYLKVILISFLFSKVLITFGQKATIDSNAIINWISVDNAKISGNGKHVMWTINNMPLKNFTLYLKSINSKLSKEISFVNASQAAFTEDSKRLMFLKSSDSLGIVSLGTYKTDFIPQIKSYKITTQGNENWAAWLTKESMRLTLHNFSNNAEWSFDSVTNYYFNETGKRLLIQKERMGNGGLVYQLELVNLENYFVKNIWNGKKAQNITLDYSGSQLAFIVQDDNNAEKMILWYYKDGMDSCLTRIDQGKLELSSGLTIFNAPLRFSKSGTSLFLLLQETKQGTIMNSGLAKVDIWTYRDGNLFANESAFNQQRIYEAVINNTQGMPQQLTSQNEKIIFTAPNEEYVLIYNQPGQNVEANWRLASRPSLYMVSIKDGSRKLLIGSSKNEFRGLGISPDSKYVVYYDGERRNYFCYNVLTSKIINISNVVSSKLYKEDNDRPVSSPPYGISFWISNENAVVVYDRYDLWKLDLLGVKQPVNLTQGFGRKSQIVFRLAKNETAKGFLMDSSDVLLSAFDLNSKNNGFYLLRLNSNNVPQLLTMGSFTYSFPMLAPLSHVSSYFPPIKAKKSNTYIVRRMTSSVAPNLFLTNDFKTFQSLTNIQPQKNYNWLTTELICWKAFDSTVLRGVLYKPENFDPHKKYPIIFYMYEKLSENLNIYLKPDFCSGPIDIPYFVSHGYLIFVPDVTYQIGKPGEGVYNSVVSAAQFMAQKAYVNPNSMGIQGHSYGGYEVNYLITKTNIFSAAASASGISDFVSDYSLLMGKGVSRQFQYESSQLRIGVSLWQNPEVYIKNSPLFYADKVNTPLLMNNNKGDATVPWEQGVEFFTALRRLEKPVWMLQYDDGDHQLGYVEAKDYTIRLEQFFDHYLKGCPPPRWMTMGSNENIKRIGNNYSLDPYGNCGNGCSICKMYNEKGVKFERSHK